ncbi:hypothetical protein ALCH109712_08770 [Alkalicoccus chagannorensis]
MGSRIRVTMDAARVGMRSFGEKEYQHVARKEDRGERSILFSSGRGS